MRLEAAEVRAAVLVMQDHLLVPLVIVIQAHPVMLALVVL